jgi:hypothetical protein
MDAVKIMAKDLVRTRRYVKKFMLMRANIQAVSLKIQTLKSQNAMAQAMKVAKSLSSSFTDCHAWTHPCVLQQHMIFSEFVKEYLYLDICWMTPHGPAGASQGVSLFIGPWHPRRLTPSSVLAS